MNGAIFSDCGKYRYFLERAIDLGLDAMSSVEGPAVFALLNPSTAAADKDDPTSRRVIGFTQRWKRNRAIIVNPFAYVSTDPGGLRDAADPVGPSCDHYVLHAVQQKGALVVIGYGQQCPVSLKPRLTQFERMIADTGVKLWCLGRNGDGSPVHPLMIAYARPLIPYAPGMAEGRP